VAVRKTRVPRRSERIEPVIRSTIAARYTRRMPSNVAQSYPYKRESEAERAAAIALTLAAREGLAERLAAEALPYDNADGDEAWAWRCRSVGCPGIMHTAGYARDRHGLVALCDACGTIALR